MWQLKYSLKQMIRTPGKTIFFLLLIGLSTTLLTLGAYLWSTTDQNAKDFEENYTTVGTVQQEMDMLESYQYWDAVDRNYYYYSRPTYNSMVPLSVLDFDGANYLSPPEKRPYYVAYNPDIKTNTDSTLDGWAANYPVLEIEPFEDCIPDHPVRMKVKRLLAGYRGEKEDEIWYIDNYHENPAPMEADKTYIAYLEIDKIFTITTDEGEEIHSLAYVPAIDLASGLESTQCDKKGNLLPGIYEFETPWDEVTPGFYETQRGKSWLALAAALKKMTYSFPVVPTNNTELLMNFYDNSAQILEGRNISEEEFSSGDRVCLIQSEFAEMNSLAVGDTIRLPLYFADYQRSSGQAYFSTGLGYNYNLINAKGKEFDVFEDEQYTIVGIYQLAGKTGDNIGFDLGYNAVVVPSASIHNSDENNIVANGPMLAYTTSFEIPNGTIADYIEAWNKQDTSNLTIHFYDRGYTQLKGRLDTMRTISIVLLLTGIISMILILVFFTHLFVGKQKKRTAIERALGADHKKCLASLLTGILIITLAGSITGCITGHTLTKYIVEQVEKSSEGHKFDMEYSLWADSAEQEEIPAFGTGNNNPFIAIILCIAVNAAAYMIASWRIYINLKKEPLELLSKREE